MHETRNASPSTQGASCGGRRALERAARVGSSALLAVAFIAGASLPVATDAADAALSGLSFLVGEWNGTGSGTPGAGAGSFSFSPDLQNQVLVRRAHSEYPAAGGRPAVVHDDLMIVYASETRAVYFDNEGHVIHYAVRVDADAKSATFVSTDPSPAPLFRLVYRQQAAEEVVVDFSIAPNGREESLKTYISGTVRRKPASS